MNIPVIGMFIIVLDPVVIPEAVDCDEAVNEPPGAITVNTWA